MQAVVVISLICAIGLIFGKIRVFGVSLGVTFVFFIGIIAGHFGITIDERVLLFAESFGLSLFVYALGLQVGPGFMSAFRSEGVKLNRHCYGRCHKLRSEHSTPRHAGYFVRSYD